MKELEMKQVIEELVEIGATQEEIFLHANIMCTDDMDIKAQLFLDFINNGYRLD